VVQEGIVVARTAVAPAAADGLVVVEGATGDGQGAAVVDGASRAASDESPGPAVAADSLVAAEGAADDGGRSAVIETAADAVSEDAVVRSPGQVAAEGAVADRGTAGLEEDAAAKPVPARRRAAEGLVAADRAA